MNVQLHTLDLPVEWAQRSVTVYGKVYPQPRLTLDPQVQAGLWGAHQPDLPADGLIQAPLGCTRNMKRSGLYELRVFSEETVRRSRKTRLVKVKSLCDYYNDPHEVAVAVWKYTHVARPYQCIVIDRGAGKGTLGPVVSYEELLRRSGSSPLGARG